MSAHQGKHDSVVGGAMGGQIPALIAAAHELKSPLALMRQLSLSLEAGDLKPAEAQKMLRQISLTSERALRLTNDLTKAARLEDAMFSLEPINPQQLCEDVVGELAPMFRAYGMNVKLAPRKHPLLLVANRDLLRRIIMNFSDNAMHYTDKNSAVEIQINALKSGEVIRLGVRDYGPALSSDIWRTLKGKLATAPQPVHARPQSSGLGLYIAGQFADAMNGKIGVIRHRDGATFYVELSASSQLSLL